MLNHFMVHLFSDSFSIRGWGHCKVTENYSNFSNVRRFVKILKFKHHHLYYVKTFLKHYSFHEVLSKYTKNWWTRKPQWAYIKCDVFKYKPQVVRLIASTCGQKYGLRKIRNSGIRKSSRQILWWVTLGIPRKRVTMRIGISSEYNSELFVVRNHEVWYVAKWFPVSFVMVQFQSDQTIFLREA